MAPVQIAVLAGRIVRVPLVQEPFWIGRDPGCDLCLWDLRVSRKHARVTRMRGEYLLSSEGRNGVFFKGEKVPVLTLKDGDEIALSPPEQADPIRLRFENALEGVFVPAEASLVAAWAERLGPAGVPEGGHGRYVYADPRAPLSDSRVHMARDSGTGAEVVLKLLPPARDAAAAEAWLRLMTAVAGAEHPALVRVLEAGLTPRPAGFLRWIATEPVPGRPASVRIGEGPQPPITVIRRLRSLAAGLHLLHSRGVVHASVVPSNVILRPDGGAVLVGLSRAFLRRDGRIELALARGESIFAAPEALLEGSLPSPSSDVYGLAAVGRAMLLGRSSGSLEEARIALPAPLEAALSRALSESPSERPTAEDFGQALAYAEATFSRASA